MPEGPLSVQDTAYWVAFYRALESERPDALFSDPYARPLAGTRGEAILARMPRGRQYGWPMVVRTAVMDEVVTRIAPRVDAVLNLAAGLDSRPYRLELPASLRWIEVDFPSMLEYKAGVLEPATAKCVIERVPLDLADVPARKELFARLGAQVRSALVITEGLLIYLSADEAGALADDLSSRRSFTYWLTDVASPFVLRIVQRTWGKELRASGTLFKFGPEDAPAFFAAHGWCLKEYHANIIEGQRLHREFPMAWLWRALLPFMWRQEASRRSGPMAGVLLLENAKSAS